MKKDSLIRRIVNQVKYILWSKTIFIRYVVEESVSLLKYNAYFRKDIDKEKIETELLIIAHSIEKGFSYRNPKETFAHDKIMTLIDKLKLYYSSFGDVDFLNQCCSIINFYIEVYRDNLNIKDIIDNYTSLVSMFDLKLENGGVAEINCEEICQQVKSIDYVSFIRSRHSYRYFRKEGVDILMIERALELAELTPTACNRQPQHVYILNGEKKDYLLDLQMGCKGFISEMHTVIYITINQKRYIKEWNQSYIDGGLYAMNLIYAFHSQGIGTIPLTTGAIDMSSRRKICKKFGIPMQEVPIMIIGIGYMENVARVNYSKRNSWKTYTQFLS